LELSIIDNRDSRSKFVKRHFWWGSVRTWREKKVHISWLY
jgi:hypothetical protein